MKPSKTKQQSINEYCLKENARIQARWKSSDGSFASFSNGKVFKFDKENNLIPND